MVAAHVRIAALDGASTVDPTCLRDLIYAYAGRGEEVEHIRVRAGPGRADILAFLDTDDAEWAMKALRIVVHKVLTGSSALRGWRIV
ncbi:hypothetical protein ABZX66_08350 [Micromonospora aurantiaca]|uniref:hypothetical protein n=1 Tax=Micromonospora aurantiaca (nom. illeg.) TaxID=47850 RepID=UPI0010759EF4